MSSLNPLSRDYPASPPISKKSFCIAGIIVDVYGLDELSPEVKSVSSLWLLHPRLSKKEDMQPVAAASISAWQAKSQESSLYKAKGLIAVAFDQRNHGTRLVSKLANEAWIGGNETHAVDMFSIFQGTARDTSQLIPYLPAYAFPEGNCQIASNIVLGVSLGGHAAWHCLLHDPRINTAIIAIGCADYERLMAHRAAKSKRRTWTSTNPAGKSFKGSKDYPPALVQNVDCHDPASLLVGELAPDYIESTTQSLVREEMTRLAPLMRNHLQGKRILNLAGQDDKLVPHSCSRPFLQWLQNATAPGGWYAGHDVHIEDRTYAGVGHAFSADMMRDSVAFIVNALAREAKDPSARI